LEVDFNALATVTDAFVDLQKKHEWGTNLPYMVSGANSLPQKEVMDWVGKRYYSLNSIIRALYHQKNNNQEEIVFEKFLKDGSYNEVLIIGGGNSVVEHQDAILEFIKKRKDICLIHSSSRNAGVFKNSHVKQYFCLVGNEGLRLEKVFNDLGDFNGICILPPSPRKMGTYVPSKLLQCVFELDAITFSNLLEDTHTSLALQTSLNLGCGTVYLAGYDGYDGVELSQREIELFNENEQQFDLFSKGTNLGLISITSTKYKNLQKSSVYSF
jgi:4-hydroxy 2-oxovalerate aldolase